MSVRIGVDVTVDASMVSRIYLMSELAVCVVSRYMSINGEMSLMKSVRSSIGNTAISSSNISQSSCDVLRRDSASAA